MSAGQKKARKPRITAEQKEAGLLWTFEGLTLVKTEFIARAEGTYRLTFSDGRTLVFSATGDDATCCTMDIERPGT